MPTCIGALRGPGLHAALCGLCIVLVIRVALSLYFSQQVQLTFALSAFSTLGAVLYYNVLFLSPIY